MSIFFFSLSFVIMSNSFPSWQCQILSLCGNVKFFPLFLCANIKFLPFFSMTMLVFSFVTMSNSSPVRRCQSYPLWQYQMFPLLDNVKFSPFEARSNSSPLRRGQILSWFSTTARSTSWLIFASKSMPCYSLKTVHSLHSDLPPHKIISQPSKVLCIPDKLKIRWSTVIKTVKGVCLTNYGGEKKVRGRGTSSQVSQDCKSA